MSFEKPPVAKYLEASSTSRAVDLINLCHLLIGEWQYHDPKPIGNYVSVFKDPNAIRIPQIFESIQQWLRELGVEITPEMMPFFNGLPITKYTVSSPAACKHRLPGPTDRVTAKDLKSESESLKPEELLEIYWRLRMYGSCGFVPVAVGQLVEEFRKFGYEGFLLPNGKVVSFESMHTTIFWFCPTALHLIDYQVNQLVKEFNLPPVNAVIEGIPKFDSVDGFQSQHVVMTFNLPEMDDEGNLGRLMIIDPTSAQFGMKGRNGEIFYWGYYQDYVKAFPAKKLVFDSRGFLKYDYLDPTPMNALQMQLHMLPLKKAVMLNMNSDFCGYCGEVERKENVKIKLGKCSGCKKAFYCDALCQKLALKGHKLECKSKN